MSMKTIYKENSRHLPIIENWNKCLSYANEKFFILFSDDDIYSSNFISEMLKLSMKYPNCSLYHCRVKQIDSSDNLIKLAPTCPEFESDIQFMLNRLKGIRIQFAPDFMCRTSSLREMGGFYDLPLAWGSDDITWYMLAKEGGVAYTPEVLCSWRLSDFNLSKVGNIDSRIDAVNSYYRSVKNLFLDYKLQKKVIDSELTTLHKYNRKFRKSSLITLLKLHFKNTERIDYMGEIFRLKFKKGVQFSTILLSLLSLTKEKTIL